MKITLHSIDKAFGGRDVFSDFSLEIPSGARLVIVGSNGAGKTTLLRMMAGVENPDAGRVLIPKGARLGYVAQELDESVLDVPLLEWILDVLPSWSDFWREWEAATKKHDEQKLAALGKRHAELEQVYGYNPEQRAHAVLSGLGFAEREHELPLRAFSGGWRERAKLGRVLVAGADILLLDEPTNHLDIEAVEWLENYLLNYKGVLALVAHDRVFMDRIGTHVLFLGWTKPLYRRGVFSDFLAWQDEIEEQQRREAKKIADEIEKKMDFVRRFKAKATKARQAGSKKKAAIKLEKELAGFSPEPRRKILNFKWPEPKRGDKTVASLVDLSFGFEVGKPLWSTLNANIYRGQKIAVVGPNGCGKSTLLKILTGLLAPDTGNVELSPATQIGYFSQHQLEILDPDKSALSEIRRLSDPKTTEEELMSVLGLFLLGQNYFDRQVRDLSGGEKSRLVLATLFLARANFLVLDEPTNHLDLESREALIQALDDYPGTMLLVAHDRWLLENVAEQVWALSAEGLTVYADGYEEYEAARRSQAAPSSDAAPKAEQDRETLKRIKREQAEVRNAIYRELKPKQDELQAKEKELEAVLTQIAEIEAVLADPEVYADVNRSGALLKDYSQARERSELLLEDMERLEQDVTSLEERRKTLSLEAGLAG
jgi:ATP-binding cassette subfamily F protein 3